MNECEREGGREKTARDDDGREEQEEEGRRRIIEGTEKGGMHSWAS